MANNTRARRTARLSRALGIALTPKAAKYLEKRPYAPGEHGRTKRKQDSDYAVRLREKQRLREQYGIREKQMRNTFNEARRKDGLTGENLVELLEMRLDALVLRAGFARTTAQARQLVVHRHILVDGQRRPPVVPKIVAIRNSPPPINGRYLADVGAERQLLSCEQDRLVFVTRGEVRNSGSTMDWHCTHYVHSSLADRQAWLIARRREPPRRRVLGRSQNEWRGIWHNSR